MEHALLVAVSVAIGLAVIGLAMMNVGLSRSRNAASAAIRAMASASAAILAFALVGVPVIYGQTLGHVSNAGSLISLGGATLVAAIVLAGVTGERTRFWPALAGSAVLAGLAIPLALRLILATAAPSAGTYPGAMMLAAMVCGGAFAAAGALISGARTGKYHRDGSSSMIPGHNLPLTVLGAMLAAVGWISLMPMIHSGGAMSAVAAVLGVAAGVLGSLGYGQIKYGKPDIGLAVLGLLGSTFAVAGLPADAGWFGPLLVGLAAGVLVPWASVMADVRLRIDDPTSGAAVTAIGPAWGLMAGAFLSGTTLAGRMASAGRVAAVVAIAAFVGAAIGGAIFYLIRSRRVLRAREADEYDGLDLAEHDIAAHPDFQHNSIRSYHLREA